MNLHPIIIHFPIACLVLYVMVEFLSLFPQQKEKFFVTKFFLLIVGVIGTFVAIQSGEFAAEGMTSRLVETHEQFAELTYWSFGLLLVMYLIPFAHSRFPSFLPSFMVKATALVQWIFDKHLHLILVLFGFGFLSITGALGGAISHGADTDFVVRWVYDVFIGE